MRSWSNGNIVAMGLTVLVLASPAVADLFIWNTQSTNRLWSRSANWVNIDENGGRPDGTTDTVYVQSVTNDDPYTDLTFRIGKLVVRTGGNLATGNGNDNNNLLTVTKVKGGIGHTLITDPGSSLTVYRSTNHADFDTDDLSIGNGGKLHLRRHPDAPPDAGGLIEVDDRLFVDSDAQIDGAGLIKLTRQDDDNDPINNGFIWAWGGTLRFFSDAGSVFDLDGDTENGALQVSVDATMIFDVAVESEFNGVMIVEQGGEMQINHPWTLASEDGSLLLFNGGSGEHAVLSGDTATLQGTVTVNVDTSLVAEVTFDADVDVTVTAGTTMEVATSAFVDAEAFFSGAGELVVNEGASLELDRDVDLGVAMRNDGVVDIADDGMTTITLASFEQGPTGYSEFTLCSQDDGESYDHLVVTGTATLDGELVLVPDSDCEPAAGDEFPIITAGSVVGEFALVTGVENAAVVYTETTVTVVVASDCAEDLDGSGTVDFGDVLAVLTAWGACEGACAEDLDASGSVDFGDLLIVLAAWGPCE